MTAVRVCEKSHGRQRSRPPARRRVPPARILDQIHRPPHTELWRMTPEDYRASRAGQLLKAEPFVPPWAADLAAGMQDDGHAAYEEGLMNKLIEDLSPFSI